MNKWPRANKFSAVKKNYGGYMYDSKKEANYAADLDLLIKAKEIKSYRRQIRLSLDVNNQHICDYYVDFAVELLDGTIEYHEVKGFPTPIGMMKFKLAKAIFSNNNFVMIK